MKRYLTAVVMMMALSVSALAGEIPSVPGPPPPGAAPADNEGDVSNGITEEITDEFVLVIFSMFAR